MIMGCIRECTVRDSLGPTIIDRVITLDKQDFIGLLSVLKVPSMIRIGFDSPSLVFTIRINTCSGNKVALRYRSGVCNTERISEYSLDRTPNLCQGGQPSVSSRKRHIMLIYIDDLKAFLEKLLGLIWKLVPDGVLCALVRLVNMDTLSWAKHISNSSIASVYG